MDSRRKEVNRLINKGVFYIVNISEVLKGLRIFNLYFVNEIKNIGTKKAFEKSRLII